MMFCDYQSRMQQTSERASRMADDYARANDRRTRRAQAQREAASAAAVPRPAARPQEA